MLSQARIAGFALRELKSDLPLTSVLGSEDDENGYFYAEIPTASESCKRYLWTGSESRVPLQFGREVVATVLGDAKLAHWKSCLVGEEMESKLATALRESLEKHQVVAGDES